MNPLYSCGFSRVGCIGCPLASRKNRQRDFTRWPKYEQLYLLAFKRMIEARKRDGITKTELNEWETAEDVMRWYIEDGTFADQIGMEEVMSAKND